LPSRITVTCILQEEVIPFFQNVRFSKDADTSLKCMYELADMIRDTLKSLDPYFSRLADEMIQWCEAWKQLNPEFVEQ
jgi:reversibly glycosylated polypeptide / UDP-arabinopyranose mutase